MQAGFFSVVFGTLPLYSLLFCFVTQPVCGGPLNSGVAFSKSKDENAVTDTRAASVSKRLHIIEIMLTAILKSGKLI
jgi:hypothetical protein